MPIEFDYRRLVHAGHVPVNAEGTGYVKPASGRMTVNTLGTRRRHRRRRS